MNTEYDVWLGLDVGKTSHHGCGLNPIGERVFDHELPQDECALRDVITTFQGEHGEVLVVVDRPNTIGALLVTVARDCGADIAYLPGWAMRKATDLYPGRRRPTPGMRSSLPTPPEACRTRFGQLIGSPTFWQISRFWLEPMRTLPMTLRERSTGCGLLLQIHSTLERVFKGTVLTRTIVLELLVRYRGPAGLRKAGKSGVKRWAKNHTRKDPSALIDAVFDALTEQTVTVPRRSQWCRDTQPGSKR